MKKIIISCIVISIFAITLHAQTYNTWVGGNNAIGQTGVYGTKGTGNAANIPGARHGSVSWTENDTFWLWGGQGFDGAGSTGVLSDLWRYDKLNYIWTWMSGNTTRNEFGTYGTKGTPSTANFPGGRQHAISWMDNDTLWLFGGDGYDGSGSGGQGDLNDLWKYNRRTGEWTWVSGDNTKNSSGIYGTMGTPSSSNVPGARDGAISWIDGDTLWLFGGHGYDAAGQKGHLNDLWKFDKTTRQWTWVSGSNARDPLGTYGTLGVGSTSNTPGGRYFSVSWYENGFLWLFGGIGHSGSGGAAGHLNDLWKFDKANRTWTWVSGQNAKNQSGAYGTLGTGSSSNYPGGREGATGWTESDTLWLFGGLGHDAAANQGYLNDLWKYNKNNGQWTWVNGSNNRNQTGTYGTKGIGSTSNFPGSRQHAGYWTENDTLWLMGGDGYDASTQGILNDLWSFGIQSCTPVTVNTEPSNVTLCAGNNATFGLLASGTITTYQWQRDISGTWTDLSGENNDTLVLTSVTSGMNGYQYRCVVAGSCGNDTSAVVTLNVQTVATVNTEPAGNTLCEGGNATFGLLASGTITGYQWQRDISGTWTNLSGETNDTLYLTSVTSASDSFLYRCIVYGGCGNDTSATALLDVITPQILSVNNDTICAGNTFTISANSFDGVAFWYNALNNGNKIHTGDTFSSTASNDSIIYVTSASLYVDTLSTPKPAGNSQRGIMFDITPNKNLAINSFDILKAGALSNVTINFYYKSGSYLGHETNAGSWTHISTINRDLASGFNQLNAGFDVPLTANQTYGFYIVLTNFSLQYTNGSSPTELIAANADMSLNGGKGIGGLFGSEGTYSPRKANVNVHYSIINCESSPRIPVYVKVNPNPNITGITSSLNPSYNSLYLPMKCSNLTATTTGGMPPYSYTWSPSGSGNPLNVCPTTGTWYTATVTDSFGCQDTMSIKQYVIDATSTYPGRVTMCVKNIRTNRYSTLSVQLPTVPYNLGLPHGNTLGACGAVPTKQGDAGWTDWADEYSIYPNPFANELNIEFVQFMEEMVTVQLTDMTGRVVKDIFNGKLYDGELVRFTVDASDLPNGMYLVRYSSDSDMRVNKVQLVR